MSADVLLAASGVRKAFARRAVLDGLDLTVCAGEMVGIVGENGSGKTTLLRVLAGLLPVDRGRVAVRGRMGYCPQQPSVFEQLTLRENLRYFSAAYGLTDWATRAATLAARLRFEGYLDARVAEVSGGTRQKLNLALALLDEPALLLLDEPYAGFDWETYLLFWELARELRAAGRGLLVVSHLVYDARPFDRILTLARGRLA